MSRVYGTGSFIVQTDQVEGKQKTHCTPTVAIATFTMIAASTLSQISFKSQGSKYNFKHGVMQGFLMFFGEWLNLMIFGGTFVSEILLNRFR